jgi:hypothetical protein
MWRAQGRWRRRQRIRSWNLQSTRAACRPFVRRLSGRQRKASLRIPKPRKLPIFWPLKLLSLTRLPKITLHSDLAAVSSAFAQAKLPKKATRPLDFNRPLSQLVGDTAGVRIGNRSTLSIQVKAKSRAWAKSSRRSSKASKPTERRRRPSEMPCVLRSAAS